MELKEMKSLWEEMSVKMVGQQKLTESLVLKATETRHRDKVNKIYLSERIAAVACAIQLVYLTINFQKLDTWYLMVCGVLAGILLTVIAVYSLKLTRRLGTVSISENNYKQCLTEYSTRKLKFISFQKLTFSLGAVLLITAIPVAGKLFGNLDFFKDTKLFMIYAVSFSFYYLFAKWVLNSYVRMANEAEGILNELKD
jgi:hypothetical protein